MANKIVQRLISAGASPARAQAFALQFAKSLPGAKPKDIQDAFDKQLADFSDAYFLNTFKPNKLVGEELDNYIDISYPDKLSQFEAISWKKAPSLLKILTKYPNLASIPDDKIDTLDALIVKKVWVDQLPIGGVLSVVQAHPLAGQFKDLGAALVTKYFGEETGQLAEYNKLKDSFVKADKYLKVNLPHPTLKYGNETDYKLGTVDYRTHPSIPKLLGTDAERSTRKAVASSPASGYIGASGGSEAFLKTRNEALNFDQNLLNRLVKSGATPFLDEVKRREFLKGKSIK